MLLLETNNYNSNNNNIINIFLGEKFKDPDDKIIAPILPKKEEEDSI